VIGTIIGAVVVGVAWRDRLVPGTWVAYKLGYSNQNGFKIIPFLVGIIIATVLIAVYVGITGRRNSSTRPVRQDKRPLPPVTCLRLRR